MHETYSNSIILPENLKSVLLEDNLKSFSIYPLQKGFALTLGNSLRRILLSSIRGTVFSSLKIEGVKHQYSSIEGVSEDVYQICHNLRSVILKSDSETSTASIKITGPKIVKAKDIKFKDSTVVLNPDYTLFEITSNREVNIELFLKSGIGDVFIDQESHVNTDPDLLLLDMHFSPVLNVSISVEDVRVRDKIDYDNLVIKVKTNGSISPEDALDIAMGIMIDMFKKISKIEKVIDTSETNFLKVSNTENFDIDKKVKKVNKLSIPIDELELSVRSEGCLKNENIKTVGDLILKSELDLYKTPNLGRKSIQEIKEALQILGLSLKDSDKAIVIKNKKELID